MKLQMIGLSHHNASVEIRERLAFSPDQAQEALKTFRSRFPDIESVLLSTCNRTEIYTAALDGNLCPTHHDMVQFWAEFHQLEAKDVFDNVLERTGEDVVRHLFTVAASLDSMVVGEAQILSQVKQAYELSTQIDSAGTLTHSCFQAAIRVAKRVSNETTIHKKRVSIPSVAVSDFASNVFDRFDDKNVLIIGAGEMAEETSRYLLDVGAKEFTVVNRSLERAERLAATFAGKALHWDQLHEAVIAADLIVSTTGATEPIIRLEEYKQLEAARFQRTLFVLDLAIPRDFDPRIAERVGVYLFSIDDLRQTCDKNRAAREREWPKAERIIEDETAKFMADLNHRATAPTIRRLKQRSDELKDEELKRLLNKLGDIDPRIADEIIRSFDRLVNKLLHPPLESLRDEAGSASSDSLLDALKRLFRLYD
ncbi:glutamyl-tRNA reductase [Blastopirellula marina]|uniref:Glutamyl-tRNA reductase n=1 Tax=Blastopirellula marina DSM 3645 TaxID=314230 RepID=A3ZM18_9BACT|nr:glutamyl-tRNA reductase [Blastopirellula marina]EAQ82801.1 glutamyl-tRNA reductase [Blastopirellula marina DSM 3645]